MISFINGDIFTDKVYVGKDGDDTKSCKDKSNMCKTLNHSIYAYPFNSTEIIIVEELNYTEYLIINMDGHEFHGDNENTTLIAIESSMLSLSFGTMKDLNIIISKGFASSYANYFMMVSDVLVSNVIFTSEAFLEMSYGIICTSYGYIKMEDCSFTNISCRYSVISSYSVINIELKGCSFVNLTSEGLNSPFINVNLSNSNINSTTFDNCSSNKDEGMGGGLTANIIENCWIGGEGTETIFKKCSSCAGGGIYISLNKTSSFAFADITFGSEDDANTATYGKNMFLYCDCLDAVADLEHFSTLKGENEDNNGLYVFPIIPDKGNEITTESLIKLINGKLKEGTNPLYIGDDGDNGKDCSSSEKGKLCLRMEDVIGKVKYDIYNISVVKQFTLSDSLHNRFRYALKGNENDTKIITSGHTIKIDYYSSFASLLFLIGDSESISYFSDEYGYYVFSTQSGSLILSSCALQSENSLSSLSGSIIYISKYANCLIENCTIKDAELLFYNGDSDRSFGCAIFADTSEYNEIIIRGVTFSNLKALNGLGGGIYANIKNGSSFIIESNGKQKTTFENCGVDSYYYEYKIIWDDVVTSDYGRGGAIYMKVESEPKKLYVDCEFGTEEEKNKALEGYDLYVYAENMKKNYEFG